MGELLVQPVSVGRFRDQVITLPEGFGGLQNPALGPADVAGIGQPYRFALLGNFEQGSSGAQQVAIVGETNFNVVVDVEFTVIGDANK